MESLTNTLLAGVSSPWLLIMLLVLLVPIAIHLLSRSKGRLVPFANIALIKAVKQKQNVQIQLVERILLALRLLLLLLATLLLAGFYISGQLTSQPSMILIGEDWLNFSNPDERQRLAQELGENTAIVLDVSQSRLTAKDVLAWKASHVPTTPRNLWAQIYAVSKVLSSQTELHVFSTNRMSQFSGNKVPIANELTWHIKDFSKNSVAENTNTDYSLDASILVLYDRQRQADMMLLKAAFDALQLEPALNIFVSYRPLNTADNQPDPPDWLFYLGVRPLLSEILQQVKKGGGVFIDDAQSDPLYVQEDIIWTSANNDPLLTRRRLGSTPVFGLTGRLDDSPDSVTQQPDFPIKLAMLLFESENQKQQIERALLSDEQIGTLPKPESEHHIFPDRRGQDWAHPWLLLLLVLLFCIERVLSETKIALSARLSRDANRPSNEG